MTGEGLRVCSACGTIAPTERASCSQCEGSLQAPLMVSASEHPLPCARVVVEMCCGACGFFFPIDGLPDDDAVDCAHCDLHQKVGAERWTAFVRTAHEVVDLARSAHHASKFNPYRDLGTSRSSHLFEDDPKAAKLRGWISPGHPVCTRCRGPLAIAADGGALRVGCPRCARADSIDGALTYDTTQVRHYKPLVGAIGLQQRLDRKQAVVSAEGPTALHCPSCGGALSMPDAERMCRCTYCETISQVPRGRLRALGQDATKQEPWWLVFSGTSRLRDTVLAREAEWAQATRPSPELRRSGGVDHSRDDAPFERRAEVVDDSSDDPSSERRADVVAKAGLAIGILGAIAGVIAALWAILR
ncbi:MAG: hypothetical protein K1X94_32450 [Sandaracinaceae bacterium]|nr:hypothetical protein [Sandaracinaceae bacterium]